MLYTVLPVYRLFREHIKHGCRRNIKRYNYDERIIYPGYPGFLLHDLCITETGKILTDNRLSLGVLTN